MTVEEKKEGFLQEYEALCRKWEVWVDACGCCDSPHLLDLESHVRISYHEGEDPIAKNVKHLRED